MTIRNRRFERDRDNKMLVGVCAGLARSSGIDVTIIRVALVLSALGLSFFWTAILYLAAAFVGRPRRDGASEWAIAHREEARDRMRSLDLRMQAIETYATSANSRLAREIDELR